MPARSAVESYVSQGLQSGLRLLPSIADQATAFFLLNRACTPVVNGTTRGFLETLIPLYETTTSDSPLHMATQAVSIHAISNGHRHLSNQARKAYSAALRGVQHAILDFKQATSDETLLTVLLLSLYEVCKARPDSRSRACDSRL